MLLTFFAKIRRMDQLLQELYETEEKSAAFDEKIKKNFEVNFGLDNYIHLSYLKYISYECLDFSTENQRIN